MKKQIVLTWIYISMMNLWSDTENSWLFSPEDYIKILAFENG